MLVYRATYMDYIQYPLWCRTPIEWWSLCNTMANIPHQGCDRSSLPPPDCHLAYLPQSHHVYVAAGHLNVDRVYPWQSRPRYFLPLMKYEKHHGPTENNYTTNLNTLHGLTLWRPGAQAKGQHTRG